MRLKVIIVLLAFLAPFSAIGQTADERAMLRDMYKTCEGVVCDVIGDELLDIALREERNDTAVLLARLGYGELREDGFHFHEDTRQTRCQARCFVHAEENRIACHAAIENVETELGREYNPQIFNQDRMCGRTVRYGLSACMAECGHTELGL